VAGFDPSGGAGILLDLKVFDYFNFYGLAVITSLTVQNTQGVKSFQPLPPDILWQQYQTLKEDFTFQGIKIGLISSVDHLEPIAQILRENSHLPRVIDPVFRSSSGKEFFPQHYLPDYVKKILPLSSLITPNLQEAEFLSGMAITTVKDLKKAAQRISNLTRGACLIKGGHLPGTPTDILVDKGKVYCFSHRKISFSVHGTGCLLSSAILALLAQKKPLFEAVSQAINFTHQQITAAVQLGEGQRLFILGKKD
jgi:hydroxymethylpyrimidine/phosphomethylpyrimidine kinase